MGTFNRKSRIYIAGHSGLLGSAILSKLKSRRFCNLITRSHKELDLTDRNKVLGFFIRQLP
jgi:GDP-L-fucose synthase